MLVLFLLLGALASVTTGQDAQLAEPLKARPSTTSTTTTTTTTAPSPILVGDVPDPKIASERIKFYKGHNYNGGAMLIDISTNCRDLPPAFHKLGSVDTMGSCLQLFAMAGCAGNYRRVHRHEYRAIMLGPNSKTMSVRLCGLDTVYTITIYQHIYRRVLPEPKEDEDKDEVNDTEMNAEWPTSDGLSVNLEPRFN